MSSFLQVPFVSASLLNVPSSFILTIGIIKYTHCNENPIYVFPEKELRGLSPIFHIYLSVSDYIFPGSVHPFSCSRILRIGRPIVGRYKSITEAWMSELGTRPRSFSSGQYWFRIFGIVSLQCVLPTFILSKGISKVYSPPPPTHPPRQTGGCCLFIM